MPLISQSPATDHVLATFEELKPEEIEVKLALAQKTFESWRSTSFAERAALMKKAGELLKKNARQYGELMTKEMGKPIRQAIAEAEKCALACDFYADNAEAFLVSEKVVTDASESYVRFDPLGIILAVMPWNFPFWQVVRFAAPALMAGNVGVLKHASNVPQCALALEQLFLDAGFPAGAFQALLIGASRVEAVIKDPRVKGGALTGSERAGQQFGMHASSEIKPTVLELGGSDPFIVLEDADLEIAAQTACTARLQNNGQSCIAAKRFIVLKNIFEDFVKLFKKSFESMVIGDPMDEKTNIGPMVNKKSREELHQQVQKSIALGAKLVTGGKPVDGPGAFYQPTILTNVKKGMPAYHEELFGPVASVITVKDEQGALEVANDTPFGLGASVWTKDLNKAKQFAARIDSGAVFINGMVKSDPRLPFGGTKRSGYGRELSRYGILEFVNVKSVWIK